MTYSIENKILVIYIIKLIRKINYLDGKPYSASDIYLKLCELDIKPCPSKKNIKSILKLMGGVEENIC